MKDASTVGFCLAGEKFFWEKLFSIQPTIFPFPFSLLHFRLKGYLSAKEWRMENGKVRIWPFSY
jgi:hypothetical protein